MPHLAAFHCAKCPRNGNPEAGPSCPAWWETVHQKIETGEVKVWKSCAWEQLPVYLTEVIKASNRPAAAVESARNEIVRGFNKLSELLGVQTTYLLPNAQSYELLNGRSTDDSGGRDENVPADSRGGE